MSNIKEKLKEAGAKIFSEDAKSIRCNAFYRNGDGAASLIIDKHSLIVTDFPENKSFPLHKLLDGIEEGEYQVEQAAEEIECPKYFSGDKELLLFPNYDYFNKRGISTETLKTFCGGVCHSGKLYNRFCFPIFDKTNGKILGYHGRDLTDNDNRPKWKILGPKSQFLYPAIISEAYIKNTNQVVLVEGGDFLFLWDAGVKQVLVNFGLHLSSCLLSYLLSFDELTIFIGTNNDANGRGQRAAKNIKKKLLGYFAQDQIKDLVPPGKYNDFGDMPPLEIKQLMKQKGVCRE